MPCDQPTLLSTTQQPESPQGMEFSLCADCGGTADHGSTIVVGILLAALLISFRSAVRPRILTISHLLIRDV